MYRNLNSIRQLGVRTQFRHASNIRHRPSAAASIRLVVLRPQAISQQRGLYLTRDLVRSAESKLGKQVAIEEKETMTSRAAALAKEQAQAAAAAASSGTTAAATAVKPKKTLWQKVKAEATHYWHGTQLLGLEIRISSSLTWKLLHGGKLTRREHRQVSFFFSQL